MEAVIGGLIVAAIVGSAGASSPKVRAGVKRTWRFGRWLVGLFVEPKSKSSPSGGVRGKTVGGRGGTSPGKGGGRKTGKPPAPPRGKSLPTSPTPPASSPSAVPSPRRPAGGGRGDEPWRKRRPVTPYVSRTTHTKIVVVNKEEPPVTTTPNAPAENVPQHIEDGDSNAQTLEDLADKVDEYEKSFLWHVEAAEALQIGGDILGQWTDAADMLRQAAELIRNAAELADAAARNEREQLQPVVDSVADAPLGDGATVGSLRD